ncbi:dermatopontin [Biomphalaria glabrata]|nr:dermatopontin [Biomphalaria glabrata]
MTLISCIIVAFSGLLVTEADYVNNYDQPFDFQCPAAQILSYISSVHHNGAEDRRWEFLCRTVGKTDTCNWSDYVNTFDEMVAFSCPDGTVMTGVSSYHDNRPEDRRFKFQCCRVVEKQTSGCFMTNYVNDYDEKLTLDVPEGHAVKGAFSCYHNGAHDRRWKFEICKL